MNDLSGNRLDEIDEALRAGSTILAVQRYREATGVTLKEAYRFVQQRAKDIGTPSRSLNPVAFRYVMGMVALGLLLLVVVPSILRTLGLMLFLPFSFAAGILVVLGIEFHMLRLGIIKWRDAVLPWIAPIAILILQSLKQPH